MHSADSDELCIEQDLTRIVVVHASNLPCQKQRPPTATDRPKRTGRPYIQGGYSDGYFTVQP